MDNLYWLDQIQPSHRGLVGDKAFYLGLLKQQGYPIMPGFVVSVTLFREFLETINWLEPLFSDLPNSSLYLDVDNSRQLQAIAQQIRQAVQSTHFSEDWLSEIVSAVQPWQATTVILRPSLALQTDFDPTASFRAAGLLNAHVAWTTPEAIAQTVKQVWAELFRARSLLYWQRSRIQLQQVNLAVLVQPIESAIASGDLQADGDRLSVRALWGLGKALSTGEVAPDTYHLQLPEGQVQSQHLGSKTHAYQIAPSETQHETSPDADQSAQFNCWQFHPLEAEQQAHYALTPEQLQQLAHIAQRLAADFNAVPVLEWTLRKDSEANPTLYLTQVNPWHVQTVAEEAIAQSPGKEAPEPALAQPPHSVPDLARQHSSNPADVEVAATHTLAWLEQFSRMACNGLAAAAGQVLATAWVVSDLSHAIPSLPPGAVLVAPDVTPDWLVELKQAGGIVAEQGGMTCHSAIMARELGIPAVVGVANATELIKTGDSVFLDGDRGKVYRIDAELEAIAPVLAAQPATPQADFPEDFVSVGGSETLHNSTGQNRPSATQLMVNLSQPQTLSQITDLPLDGLGLLRSELMILELLDRQPLHHWLQQDRQPELVDRIAERVAQFAEAFHPRPVFYRSLDVRSHEFPTLVAPAPAEKNPMLGLRGTFRYQVHPASFEVELAALKQVQRQGFHHLHLILPFVRTVEEFRFCQHLVEQAGLRHNPHFQLWIMAEVPSVLLLLPDYVEAGVQGIAIGTNDLTQLLLGIDRDQADLAIAFDQHHPAVLRAIRQLVEVSQQLGIPCSICGQAPSQYPDLIDALVRWGITAISVSPSDVAPTQRAIARAEQRLLLEAARHKLAIEAPPEA